MRKNPLFIHPTNSELDRLKIDGFLDKQNRPMRMTHLAMREIRDGEEHVIAMFESVFLSSLLASSNDKVIIFDREGKAFEIKVVDVEPIRRSAEVHAI